MSLSFGLNVRTVVSLRMWFVIQETLSSGNVRRETAANAFHRRSPSLHAHPRRVRRTERSVLLVADDAHAAYSETARSAKAHRAAAHGCEDIVGLAYLISKTTALITPYGGDTVTMRDQIVA